MQIFFLFVRIEQQLLDIIYLIDRINMFRIRAMVLALPNTTLSGTDTAIRQLFIAIGV